jgi:hypothetical protein
MAGVIHFHDRFDAFATGERKNLNGRRGWHWVPIERDYMKAVTRQMEVDLVRGPGMNKVKPHALAGSHSDYVSGIEPPVTDGEEDLLFVVDRRECWGAHRRGSSGPCG